ncbi:hypothetical protein FRB95_014306 [Tulasnella sp. JGI-2019a]|nr:hypothetical protein FRB95_014306 [Tulasnella sp. JGI-2019a]
MPIKSCPDFDEVLRHPPQERLCILHALEVENQRLRDTLAKAEAWGGGLEAINGAAQVQLTVQNIAYASAVKQLNAKENKQTAGKQSVVRVTVENQIWTKPDVQEELRGIEGEWLRLKLAKEAVSKAHQSLTQLQKAWATWKKLSLVDHKAQRKVDLMEWRKEVDKHKVLTVTGKGRAPQEPACCPKAIVLTNLLSPKKASNDLDDEESLDGEEDEAEVSGEED